MFREWAWSGVRGPTRRWSSTPPHTHHELTTTAHTNHPLYQTTFSSSKPSIVSRRILKRAKWYKGIQCTNEEFQQDGHIRFIRDHIHRSWKSGSRTREVNESLFTRYCLWDGLPHDYNAVYVSGGQSGRFQDMNFLYFANLKTDGRMGYVTLTLMRLLGYALVWYRFVWAWCDTCINRTVFLSLICLFLVFFWLGWDHKSSSGTNLRLKLMCRDYYCVLQHI